MQREIENLCFGGLQPTILVDQGFAGLASSEVQNLLALCCAVTC